MAGLSGGTEGGTRTQIWVVTTDPEDRMAWRIDGDVDGTAALIGWDGTRVAAILTGEDGVGQSCLIDPADGHHTVLDRRSGGRLVDAWDGASLIRVGPRGYREMIMLYGADRNRATAFRSRFHDRGRRHPRRPPTPPHSLRADRSRPSCTTRASTGGGYVRALIRSDNGCEHARLVEVTATEDGVSYSVVAERPDCDLDEFAVSDDLSTIALLWNIQGCSELQILEYTDNTLTEPIPLPGLVAGELSISAGGSMVAMTVQGPSMPRTVELVDPRTRQWQSIDREPSRGPVAHGSAARPVPQMITARDGLNLPAWLYRPEASGATAGAVVYLHGGPEAQARPEYSEIFPELLNAGISVLTPNVRGSGGLGRTFVHADDKEKRFAAIDDVADCVRFLVDNALADPRRIACAGWSYGGYLTMAAMTFHPDLFAAGVSICGMSDLTTFYRNTEPWIADAAYPKYGHPVNDRELLEQLSPLRRVDALTAPLLVVHGANDTNVAVSESEQIVDALRRAGRDVRFLLFDDDGHEIVKRENRTALAAAMRDWLARAFDVAEGSGRRQAKSDRGRQCTRSVGWRGQDRLRAEEHAGECGTTTP